MASVAFGRSVDVIDEVSLSVNEIAMRDKYGSIIKRFIVDGYCLMSLDPIVLYKPKTKHQKIIAVGPIGVNENEKDNAHSVQDDVADEIIGELSSQIIKPKKKSFNKNEYTQANISKLTYHGDNLTSLGAVKRVKGLPIPFPPYGYC